MRTDKINYYLDIAETVLERGTCLRRNFGAIIVSAPRQRQNCSDMGFCLREKLNVPRGTRYELCRSVHAEANAIISASRNEMIGATLYLCGKEKSTGAVVENAMPCSMCKRMIINAGINDVYIRDDKENYRHYMVSEWIENDDSLGIKEDY